LEMSFLESLEFRFVLVVDVLLLLGLEYHSGFFFHTFFFFFWLFASVLPLVYCVVADVGYYWYILILIYFLYK
jgi:hypothetical protein